MNDLAYFAKLVEALEPWRRQLVIVGGWAHRLQRLHPLATAPNYQPLLTKDTDLAFGDRILLEGDIRSALADAGFNEELAGDHNPPVSKYTLGEDDAGFYAEFLTPLRGSGMKRDGKSDATVAKAGITAQKLRHLEILLIHPWLITFAARIGEENAQRDIKLDLQVANPVSFIVQKLLIHDDRKPEKRAQDILYIHDTIELFSSASEQLASEWAKTLKPELGKKLETQVTERTRQLFSSVTDSIREAVQIAQRSGLTPDILRARCELGLNRILIAE